MSLSEVPIDQPFLPNSKPIEHVWAIRTCSCSADSGRNHQNQTGLGCERACENTAFQLAGYRLRFPSSVQGCRVQDSILERMDEPYSKTKKSTRPITTSTGLAKKNFTYLTYRNSNKKNSYGLESKIHIFQDARFFLRVFPQGSLGDVLFQCFCIHSGTLSPDRHP